MSLPPTIPANYTQTAVINTLNDGVIDFTTEQDGQGLKIINNTTSGYLEISSAGAIVSPDGIATYPINFKDLSAITTNTTPQELVVVNTIAVQDATTTPPNNIQIQAGVIGVGTNFGIEYSSSTDQDFTIFCDENNTGGVVFKQQGFGASTTETEITQGTIVSRSDSSATASATLQPTSLSFSSTSGDIIAGSYTGNAIALQDDATGSSVGTAGINATAVNSAGTLVSSLGGGVVGMSSPPFPAPDANWSLSVQSGTYNPTLFLSKSAPFTNSTSLTLGLTSLAFNQGTGSPSPDDDFTISSTKDLLISSNNFNVSASSLTIPATGQPITAQLTQDGLTMLDTTSSWNSFYRKSQAFISNLAGTIYTFITNQLVQVYTATAYSALSATDLNMVSNVVGATGSAVLRGLGRLAIVSAEAVGYATDYLIELTNSNSAVGNTTGVPSISIYKSGRNVVQNDIIYSQQFYAKNYLGTKTLFGKVESLITNSSAGAGDDGALDFYTCVNGTSSLVMRLNGADNENNSYRPVDLNGNALKTSSGSMTIDTSGSSGTGSLTLATKDGTAGSGAGLLLTGNTLLSGSAGGNSGQHLCLTIGGTAYKIALLNP